MTRFLSFAGILTYHGFKIWSFGWWLRLLAVDLARSAPPLRGGRRIACPFGGTPPPARELSACPFVNSRQGILARHLGWSFAAHVVFLEPSGVLLGPLGASWGALGNLLEPLGVLLGGS